MGSPFFVPKLVREHDFHGKHLQVIEVSPKRYIAVVWDGTSNTVIMNPVRGDHFQHIKSAHRYAKRFIRGQVIKPTKQ